MRNLCLLLALAGAAAAAAPATSPAAVPPAAVAPAQAPSPASMPVQAAAALPPPPDAARLKIMRAIAAAGDKPFIEPAGDLRALLLGQNPTLAAPDCGVRYKLLDVEGGDALTLLVAPQGRCRREPGMPPQWVLQVGVAVRPVPPPQQE